MSEPSETAVSEFVDWTTKLRLSSTMDEVNRIYLLSNIRSLYFHLTQAAKREEIMEAQVTRALVDGATGGDGAGPSRAELKLGFLPPAHGQAKPQHLGRGRRQPSKSNGRILICGIGDESVRR